MSSLRGQRILIIEDSRDVMLLARKILEADGASIIEAESVEAGIGLAKDQTPHLVITDLKFPVGNGFDFLIERKSSPHLSGIPTVVLSGMKDKDSVIRAIGLGAADYLVKPFRATQLLQKVRKALMAMSFHTCRFQPDKTPKAKVSVPVELAQLNEVGVDIESSIKLAPGQDVVITSDLFDQIGISDVVTRTVGKANQYVNPGRYRCEIGFFGTNQEYSKQIRAFLKGLP